MQKILVAIVPSLRVYLFLMLFLAVVCSGCSLFGDDMGTSTHVKQSRGTSTSTPSAIRLGVQPCPATVQNPMMWKHVVVLGAGQSVEQVLCGNLLGIAALQAVVMVRHTGSDRMLDVFVYSDITGFTRNYDQA